IASDRCAGRLKPCTDRPIDLVSRRIEGQGIHRAKHGLHLRTQSRRRLLRRAVPQLRSDDDACADVLFADGLYSIRYTTAWIPDQVRHDVRVEQVAHQISTSSGVL